MAKAVRVVITGPSDKGRFPYRIERSAECAGQPLVGFSAAPLLEACRTLKFLGEPDPTIVTLHDEDRYRDTFRMRTTVGVGANLEIGRRGFKPRSGFNK